MTTSQQRSTGQPAWRSTLDVIATLAIIGAAVTMILRSAMPGSTGSARSTPPAPVPPKQPVALADVPFIGAPSAKVTMLEFSDFQCPFCARFAKEILPALKNTYIDPGVLQMGFRHNPLPIHNRAQRAAQSSICALRQDKFWPMHDALFAKPNQNQSLEDAGLENAAAVAGLDLASYRACMAAAPAEAIKKDAKLAAALGLTGTPAFAVGTRNADGLLVKQFVLGAQPIEVFRAAIDAVIKVR